MTDFAVGALVRMDEIREQDAALEGLPVRNYPSTPGYHAPASETPGSPGWTTHVRELKRHPTNPAIYAYQVPDGVARGLLAAMLTPAAAALVNSAAPLNPEEWEYPAPMSAATLPEKRKS